MIEQKLYPVWILQLPIDDHSCDHLTRELFYMSDRLMLVDCDYLSSYNSKFGRIFLLVGHKILMKRLKLHCTLNIYHNCNPAIALSLGFSLTIGSFAKFISSIFSFEWNVDRLWDSVKNNKDCLMILTQSYRPILQSWVCFKASK